MEQLGSHSTHFHENLIFEYFPKTCPENSTLIKPDKNTLLEAQCLYTEWSKSLCAPDDYSTKNTQTHFKQFQSLTMITQFELRITDGVSVSLVSKNVWRLAGDSLNNTCNFLYCNHQEHRHFMNTLYINISLISSQNEKCATQKLCRKSQPTFYVLSHFYLCRLWDNV
jgi:hypothetical protein